MSESHALLLTDVVDSTQLASELGDARMTALWAAHDRAARDLLAPFGGREIDKSDGFLLLFGTAADAIAYAAAYHAAIAPLGLRARAGVHVGPITLRENEPTDVARGAKPLEVEGIAKAITARIMSVANGGSTLASAAAAPPGATPRGHWRLKGVLEPVALFEVSDAGTPPADTAKAYRVVRPSPASDLWLPLSDVPHNLPAERDAFVGRDSDLLDLARRLDAGARLVSVLGTGGSGKTRLVTRFGWTWLGDWPGGVWFCDLSEARGFDGVVAAVGRALGVPLSADPVPQLGHAIAGRGRCLVVLDNFEQVAAFAEDTLGHWLDRAKEAAFVVTTREILGLRGEEALALPPLGRAEAIALFETRGAAAKRGWRLTDDERADVATLVELLDRLPLCIELAAARLRLMPPKALVARMGERFQLLTVSGARRDRQATLRGVIDWSWDLLGPAEQAALAQLSVFEGGFTLEAAEGVLDLAAFPDAPWPMDAVQSLVDKSLVRDLGGRFDLLVSVQMYAAERLADGAAATQARHGAYFAAMGAQEPLLALTRRSGVPLRLALATEAENLVVACRRATQRRDGVMAAALLRVAREVLQLAGPYTTQLALADGVLALPDLTPTDRAWSALAASRANEALHRIEATAACLDVAEAAAALAPPEDTFLALAVTGNRGGWLMARGKFDAASARYERARDLATRLGEPGHVGGMNCNLAILQRFKGDLVEARRLAERSLAQLEATGHALYLIQNHGLLADIATHQGRLRDALRHLDAAMGWAKGVGNRYAVCQNQCARAPILRSLAQAETAHAELERSLEGARAIGALGGQSVTLVELGWTHLALGRPAVARGWFAQGAELAVQIRDAEDEASAMLGTGEALRLEGDPDGAEAAYQRARGGAPVGAVDGALGRVDQGLALIALGRGRLDEALTHALAAEETSRAKPPNHAHALATLARVHLGRADVPAARAALGQVDRTLESVAVLALVEAVDALVCAAAGDGAGADAAIARATARGAAPPGSEVARLLDVGRRSATQGVA